MPRPFLLAILLPLALAQAQLSYRPMVHPTYVELLSPWSGPGAAQRNPAALSGTGKAYAHFGAFLMEGEMGSPVFQFAGDLPAGFSAGLGGFWNLSSIDNSNAVYLEGVLAPALAFAWPLEPEGGYRLALGVSRTTHFFNAFGAMKSRDASWDLGLQYSLRPPAEVGWFRIGTAVQRLIRPSVELPDRRGSYSIPRERNLSLAWSSPANRLEAQLGFSRILYSESDAFREMLTWSLEDVETWGLQFAPIPWLAFKVEVPFHSWLATYGAVAKLAPLLGHPILIETNLGNTDGNFPLVPEKIWGDNASVIDGGLFLTLTVGAEF